MFSSNSNLPFKPYPPRAEQTLTFYPRGHEVLENVASGKVITRPRSLITGQYVERTNRHLGSNDFVVFIVEFRPGVLRRIIGVPFHELTNTFADAELVFSGEIRKVNKRLSGAERYEEMVDIVESFLLGVAKTIARDAHPVDNIANLLICNPEAFSMDELADASCLCPRQFERKFKDRMGIGPKLFARIARVNKACRVKYTYPQHDWLTVALRCGYHDYQHMAKDFKELAGVTPLTYLVQDSKAPETYFGLQDTSMME